MRDIPCICIAMSFLRLSVVTERSNVLERALPGVVDLTVVFRIAITETYASETQSPNAVGIHKKKT